MIPRSDRSDDKRAAEDPNMSSPHRNRVSRTRRRPNMKRRIGSVVLVRGCKTQPTVSSAVLDVQAVRGTDEMQTESRLQPEKDDYVSARTLDR